MINDEQHEALLEATLRAAQVKAGILILMDGEQYQIHTRIPEQSAVHLPGLLREIADKIERCQKGETNNQ